MSESLKIASSASGMVEVSISANGMTSTATIVPMQALYYADLLKSVANVALKHNSNEETEEDDG